jgi:MFS family permease
LGAFAAGTALGWTSNLEKNILKDDNEYGFNVDTLSWAFVSSILNIGAAVGCLITGVIANTIGRKKTLLLNSIPFIIGWILIIFAKHSIMLIIGRGIIGLACGMICVVGPVS